MSALRHRRLRMAVSIFEREARCIASVIRLSELVRSVRGSNTKGAKKIYGVGNVRLGRGAVVGLVRTNTSQRSNRIGKPVSRFTLRRSRVLSDWRTGSGDRAW